MTVRLHIEKLIPGGDGLARHEGRVVFVPGVLPDEDVAVEITEAKKDFARARLVSVETTSPDRVPHREVACGLAGVCGGCDWLHIEPAAQARLKVELVRDSLRRLGGFDRPDLAIETGAPLGYRNRVQVHADGRGAVGFQARGRHDVVPVKACPVAHPALAPLFSGGAEARGPARFMAYGHAAADGAPRLYRADETPDAEITVRVLDRDIVFPLRGFFQSNLEMTQRLVPYVLEGLSGKTALDLYGGVGLFGAFLKDSFERVVCVEFNRHALAYARRNIGPQGAFVQEALEKVVTTPGGNPLDRIPAEAAVIDPPREGLDKAVRAWLTAKPVPRLTYVSCNPVTLARDLKDLLAGPYELEDLRVFDFYPQTSHIEAVAKLRSKAAG